MPRITLPDGSTRDYNQATSAAEVAADIGPGLAKAAIGARINGQLSDLHAPITEDAELGIVTSKPRAGDEQGKADMFNLIRHSCAHVMAEAVQRIVPEAQLVYGPPLETGFYYDIAFPESRPLREGDFEAIEKEMAEIIKEDRPFTRYELPLAEGMEKLKGEGSKYKLDNAERAAEAGSSELSWYATGNPGENWEDLCRGPHVPSTGKIGAAKVMSLASSYWHGDENADSLTRVYGTCFPSKKELDKHLEALEEAKERDHRAIGKKLGLFHIDDMVGQGLVLWTPKGSVVRQELQNFISEELTKQGYSQVFTPHIGKLDLYRTSGHFPYYQDSQYPPIIMREQMEALASEGCSCAELSNKLADGEIEGYLLKPMNCPHHIRLFKSQPHSYRDLPVRFAEFGTVYRWEQSGELNGMTRVRGFTQDDAHLFVTPDQIADEVMGCISIVKLIFSTLGMEDYRVRVGLRDPDSSKFVGDAADWDLAEKACLDAAESLGVSYTKEPGEAAFYGPKIDFVVKDVIGREWQLGTVQVDYNLPKRFGLTYIGADNQTHVPVMIHRAPFGSMERFIGVLIEHYAGAFPLWLAPEQVRVLPISEKTNEYGESVLKMLKEAGLRATLDTANERVQAKIKVAAEEKIPYLAVVGPRDAEAGNVSIRAFGIQKDLGAMGAQDFVSALKEEFSTRGGSTLKSKFE
jgi:threonyl-tRNA synthetase